MTDKKHPRCYNAGSPSRTVSIRFDVWRLIAFRDPTCPHRTQPVGPHIAAVLDRADADGTIARLLELSDAHLRALSSEVPTKGGSRPVSLRLPPRLWEAMFSLGLHPKGGWFIGAGVNNVLIQLMLDNKLGLSEVEQDRYNLKRTPRPARSARVWKAKPWVPNFRPGEPNG